MLKLKRITIPNLPTDNLYKFCFIAGLTLCLTSIILFVSQKDKLNGQLRSVHTELSTIGLDLKFLKEDYKELLKEYKSLNEKSEKDFNKLEKQYNLNPSTLNLKEIINYLNEKRPKDEALNKIFDKRSREIDLIGRKIERNNKLAELKDDYIKEDFKKLEELYWYLIAALLFGVILFMYGGICWLQKVQSPLDKKIEFELKKAELEMLLLEKQVNSSPPVGLP